jgi:hypothetical protein
MTSAQLTEVFNDKIQSIKDGYEVESSDVSGHDEDGAMVEYTLKNGMIIDSWNIKKICEDEIWYFKKTTAHTGISFNGLLYFVNPEFCLQENPILIPITNDEAFKDDHQNKLKQIVTKFIKYKEELYEQNKRDVKKNIFEQRNLSWENQDLIGNIFKVVCSNPEIFIQTMRFIFKEKSYNVIDDMLLRVGLDEEELELLKLGLDKE